MFFKYLGVSFDCKLEMAFAIDHIVGQSSWRISAILRFVGVFDVVELMHVLKKKGVPQRSNEIFFSYEFISTFMSFSWTKETTFRLET